MKTKRYFLYGIGQLVVNLLIPVLILVSYVVQYFLYEKKGLVSILIAVIAFAMIVYEIIMYLKDRKKSIVLDGERLCFVECAVIVKPDNSKQEIGDMQLDWGEIEDVYVSSRNLKTKSGEIVTADDRNGWLQRKRIWKAIAAYHEEYQVVRS